MTIPQPLLDEVLEFTSFLDSPAANLYEVVESRFDCMKFLTQRVERSGNHTEDELITFREWFRAATDPWVIRSPMVARARNWPEGYPGDYKTLEAVYANSPSGDGVGRHIDSYVLSRTLAVAVRSRCRMLTKLLDQRAREEAPGARWLNLACGPCRELVALAAPADSRTIYCVDSDENSLNYAKDLLADRLLGDRHFVTENAYRFVNAKRTTEKYGQFTTIYSAGLFDYIPSDKLSPLLRGLYDSLAPGGLFIAPFKDRNRYETFDYHWFLKWHYFYQRTEPDFRAIFADAGVPDREIIVQRDDTGVLLFFTVRKQPSA
jgi:extracellular factor (EF) 3-hydroxypalmitic acid methyl ester biosynthesis protein